MAVWERQTTHNIPTSFSSSLLQSIYDSIDESIARNERTRKKAPRVLEEDAATLRRAIMIEVRRGHFPSNSGSSSTDSSTSSSTETDSSATTRSLRPRTTRAAQPPPPPPPVKVLRVPDAKPKRDGKSASVKSRAQKIYGDLKKVREPNSPGGRIASFLNSIFNPRSLKSSITTGSVMKSRSVNETKAMGSVIKSHSINHAKTARSVMKSRSVNESKTCSRSCLSRSQFLRGNNNNNNNIKSKRSVRFCPVDNIADQDSEPPCGRPPSGPPTIGSQYIKKNIDSIRLHEQRKHELRDCYYNKKNHERDIDEMSCASSDLFELEANIIEDLPVYGTTSFKVIAGELVM